MIVPILALALVAQATGQFDLICTGQQFDRLQGGRGTAFETHLRIDLEANRWCADECVAGRQIISATPDKLVLEKVEPGSRGLRISRSTEINRIEGSYEAWFSLIGASIQQARQEAQCELAPFSGMPTPRF